MTPCDWQWLMITHGKTDFLQLNVQDFPKVTRGFVHFRQYNFVRGCHVESVAQHNKGTFNCCALIISSSDLNTVQSHTSLMELSWTAEMCRWVRFPILRIPIGIVFIGPESDHCLPCHSLTHWLTHSVLFSKLVRCDPGVWRCQLKTCWGCYYC